jgi:hypothetical protein
MAIAGAYPLEKVFTGSREDPSMAASAWCRIEGAITADVSSLIACEISRSVWFVRCGRDPMIY